VTTTVAAAISCALLAGACHERTVDPRTRVLDALPSATATIVVANGAAVSGSVLDAVRPFVPAGLACVLDAVPGAEAIGVSVGDSGAVVAIAVHALPRPCPALSRYEPDLWIATVGDGRPSTSSATGVLASAAWARARPYLLDAPIAVATARLIGTARTEPLELWIAADGDLPPAFGAAWREAKLDVARHGTQIIARSPDRPALDLQPVDLAALVRASLRVLVEPAVVTPPAAFTIRCAASANVVRCGGHELVVHSIAAALGELATAAGPPVVANGVVAGIRLEADALGFAAGDIVLAVDARRITSAADLRALASAHAIAVRRGTVDLAIDVRQQE
jgi:hypothetical protein